MSKTKIYLCGPIAGCSDAEAHDWRDWVKKQVETQYGPDDPGHPNQSKWKMITKEGWANCLDPMRRDYRGAGLAGNDEGGMPDWVKKEIVELDKIDIVQSDVLLGDLTADKKMVGSNMEIIYAWMMGKLVVLVLPKGAPVSPWHSYHSHKIVNTLQEALDYIHHGNWRSEKVFA